VFTVHESNPNHTRNRELLIVEDEGVTALHLREHLEKLGYTITAVAGSGEQALRILEERRPDLVLMDVTLAGRLSGTQTAKIIDERFRIPVVYMTAHNDEATLEEINATGGYGFLTKPIREVDLHPVIQLAVSRREKELQELEAERKCWQDLCQHAEGQLEQFTYAAGHDLKEPLRTARSFIELLARRLESRLSSEERELMSHAQAGLTRMNVLLEDLLAYAQAGLSQGAPIPETPAKAALKWAIETFAAQLRRVGAASRMTLCRSCEPILHSSPGYFRICWQTP
jgi:CheY-like chemotaxis protein